MATTPPEPTVLHLCHADEPTLLRSCHTLGGDGGGGVYLATCDGGLEDQLAAEVREKQGTVTAVQRGQVTFSMPSGLENRETVHSLKCADGIFALVCIYEGIPKTHAGLAAAARRLEEDPGWRPAASLLREWLPNLPEVPTYRATGVRRAVAGKHEYTSMDAAMAAGAALGTVFGEWEVSMRLFDVEAVIWVLEERLTVAFSLLYSDGIQYTSAAVMLAASGFHSLRVDCQSQPKGTLASGGAHDADGSGGNRTPPALADPPQTLSEALETPLKALETPLEALETPLEALETPLEAIQTPLEAIQTPLEAVQTPLEAIKTPLEAVHTPLAAVQTPLEAVQTPMEAKHKGVMLHSLRRYRQALTRTALKPSTAHSLLRLAALHQMGCGAVVVDPCCGCGTLPLEAAAHFNVLALGGDNAEQCVHAAATNAHALARACTADTGGSVAGSCTGGKSAAGGVCDLLHWSARKLPLRPGVVDVVVSDLPFGVKCMTKQQLSGIHQWVAREAARLLRPVSGRMVLLVANTKAVDVLVSAGGAHLALTQKVHVDMEGLPIQMVVMQRTAQPWQ